MKIIYTGDGREFDFLNALKSRQGKLNRAVNEKVQTIIHDVEQNGDAAVRKYTLQFEGGSPGDFKVPYEALKGAYDNAEPAFIQALTAAKKNIEAYHKAQVQKGYELKGEQGVILGQTIRGLQRVGIYVPGGSAAYPSTVLMNAIPAKLAGVEEIIMVTPPMMEKDMTGNAVFKGNPDILAAAYLAGVDEVFLVGGAQAVGALAYGTESIPQVDKIVGPGNIYVAAAKRMVFGQVDIDMIAGPSEILVLADEKANPRYIAADLLSQAEHDEMASSVLLTTSEEIAGETQRELTKQLEQLSRKEMTAKSLENYGAIIVCKDMDEMIKLANLIAPEHLELLVEEPMKYIYDIRNAGSVFCGAYAPEPLGDYLSGTNHVLPTSGTARFSSPLGVHSFVKKMSYTYYTREALEKEKDYILTIAEKEGLDAHGNAIKVRFE